MTETIGFIIAHMTQFLDVVVEFAIVLFEFTGVCVVIWTGIQGLYSYLHRSPDTKLIIAEGLTMGLEFKLGGEVLRTVLVQTFREIAMVGCIILLRLALTLLLHWEIKVEKKEREEDIEESETAIEQKEK